ncbi:MAG: hypothetical protein RIS83_210 [Pseudomonadota bacterium]|jgi:hypothetical protein
MGEQITAAEIRAILGPVDDVLLVEISRTGANAAEVQEAFIRLEGDEALGKQARRSASDTVRAVMALLLAAELPITNHD